MGKGLSVEVSHNWPYHGSMTGQIEAEAAEKGFRTSMLVTNRKEFVVEVVVYGCVLENSSTKTKSML